MRPESRKVVMLAVEQLRPVVGREQARRAIAMPAGQLVSAPTARPFPAARGGSAVFAARLTEAERETVLTRVNEERLQDCLPAQVCTALLEQLDDLALRPSVLPTRSKSQLALVVGSA